MPMIPTNISLGVPDMGVCDLLWGAYSQNNAPALVVRNPRDAGAKPVTITYNIPELNLPTDKVVLHPKFASLAATLEAAGVLVARPECNVMSALGATPAKNLDANLLVAGIHKLSLTPPAELYAPIPAAAPQAETSKAVDQPAEPAEEQAEEQTGPEPDDQPDDVDFIMSLTLGPDRTYAEAIAEFNTTNPVFRLDQNGGRRSKLVDKEKQAVLNAAPAKTQTPSGFIMLRDRLKKYIAARDELDNALIEVTSAALVHLDQKHRAVILQALHDVDAQISVGIYDYLRQVLNPAGDFAEQVLESNTQYAKSIADFDYAMEEAGGDFQRSLLYMSINRLPDHIKSILKLLDEELPTT